MEIKVVQQDPKVIFCISDFQAEIAAILQFLMNLHPACVCTCVFCQYFYIYF